MREIPALWDGREAGTARLTQEALYTRLDVRVPVRPGLWCVWAEGERGELRVGILEPAGGYAVISRRFSRQSLRETGEFQRCEIRAAAQDAAARDTATRDAATRDTGQREPACTAEGTPSPESWTVCEEPELPLRDPWIRRQYSAWREAVSGTGIIQTVFTRRARGLLYLAFPAVEDAPFPLPGLFCFSARRTVKGRPCWVFAFEDGDKAGDMKNIKT